MNSGQDDVYLCPSFNSYSTDKLAEIAVTVAANRSTAAAATEINGGDDDFEFALVCPAKEAVFPIFNRDLIESSGELESNNPVPLRKLFAEEDDERDFPPSCSSSEADEPENIPATAEMPSKCKKSKSTGSVPKRWKIRDLLRRSKSDGKESFAFLNPKHRQEKSEKLSIGSPKKGTGRGAHSEAAAPPPSAHEALYVRNRAMKEGDKKKSYLPYRRDIVGFFANVNGVRRSFSHF